jgi:hypothetical protein
MLQQPGQLRFVGAQSERQTFESHGQAGETLGPSEHLTHSGERQRGIADPNGLYRDWALKNFLSRLDGDWLDLDQVRVGAGEECPPAGYAQKNGRQNRQQQGQPTP